MTKSAQKPFATATFRDTYAGDVAMHLVGSASTRHGAKVTVWTWQTVEHLGVHAGYHGVVRPERAVRNATTDRRFSNVQTVQVQS